MSWALFIYVSPELNFTEGTIPFSPRHYKLGGGGGRQRLKVSVEELKHLGLWMFYIFTNAYFPT